MLKLMNAFLILVILCDGVQSINEEALQCKFEDITYFGTLYSCSVTALENPNDNKIITGYSGNHQPNKYDTDVKQIYIDGTNTKYITANLGTLLNLKGLAIQKSQLVEIRSKDFQGMQNLEYLSLHSNKLTSIPSDAFSTLPKLREIYLHYNQIKYIGSGAFDQLTNLNAVFLSSNICVNKYYYGTSAITQMKHDLKVFCVDPISTSTTTTTTTTTTTQNPLEAELEALRNEANNQQQKNEIELKKLRDELQMEKSENIKVKNEKDALAIEKGEWIKEKEALMKKEQLLMSDKDALKMELSNKISEINELKTNCNHRIEAVEVKLNEFIGMKQNQEDLKKMMEQLLKASQEHQIECNEIIKLRAELVTAKEEQKKEQLEYLKVNKEKDALMKKKDALMIYHNALMKDKDALKKELTEAKATCEINERSLI